VRKFEIDIGGVDHRPVNRPAIYRTEIVVYKSAEEAPQGGRSSEDWQAMKSWNTSIVDQFDGPDGHHAQRSVSSATLFADK
jgi:hypothetical protein